MFLEEFARSSSNVTSRKFGKRIGPNQLLWDFGVDHIYNDQVVEKKIKEMDDKFHLVMILEHFQVDCLGFNYLIYYF